MTKNFIRKRFILPLALLSIVCVLALMAGSGLAQTVHGTIKGTVVDSETDYPLIGTNIVIMGTRLGATTDIDGNYEIIRVPPGNYQLQVSFIGYQSETRDVTVQANATVTEDFALNIDILSLDEVVVTGMGGTQIKEKLGVSIASVKAETIIDADEPSLVASLHGKAAGITRLPEETSRFLLSTVFPSATGRKTEAQVIPRT